MDFRRLDAKHARRAIDRLLPSTSQDFQFRSFRFLQKKILRAETLLQRRNFVTEHWAEFRHDEPVFFVNFYRSQNPEWESFQAIGFPLIRSEASLPAISSHLVANLTPEIPCHIPLEAHINLGISYPAQHETTAFLTAPFNELQAEFFSHFPAQKTKTYHALKLTDPTVLKTRIDRLLSQVPEEFSFRPVSRLWFRRDMKIYSQLVQASMSEHELFYPIREEEELELLMGLRWIFDPRFFQFLLHKGREIGFVFAIPDFNEVLDPAKSDGMNLLRLMTRKNQIRKGRIIYKGILPEYRGQGIFRYLRHHVLGNFLKAGYIEIEGSYIDEKNQASLGDAQSTFFTKSHVFSLKTL